VDGGGLMLVVRPSGSAAWVLRYQIAGRRRDMGLGAARGPGSVSLADARARAGAALRLARSGADPLEQREAEAAMRLAEAAAASRRAVTFADAAERYLAAHSGGWRNAKHRQQWETTLREHAGPRIGAMPVAEVETQHVEAVLRVLWHQRPETASRLRGRMEAVLDFAVVRGWRPEGPNPARWRGHLDKLFPRRTKVRPVRHHAALPWQDVPAFLAELRAMEGVSARALEFCLLTAARSGEVLGARWREMDLGSGVWTVPASRMKAGREHRVALSPATVALLRATLPMGIHAGPDALVFPGRGGGGPLGETSLRKLLRRMGRGGTTVHGLRSTFRDWAGEATAHPREVVEAALSHRTGNRVEQAYARGDLFARRRLLMRDWSEHCGQAGTPVRGPDPWAPTY
jgi:integrase